jgi:hypothetical protein
VTNRNASAAQYESSPPSVHSPYSAALPYADVHVFAHGGIFNVAGTFRDFCINRREVPGRTGMLT